VRLVGNATREACAEGIRMEVKKLKDLLNGRELDGRIVRTANRVAALVDARSMLSGVSRCLREDNSLNVASRYDRDR
jgi:hypothetical protein